MIQSQQGLHQDSIPVMLMYYSFKSNRQDAKGAIEVITAEIKDLPSGRGVPVMMHFKRTSVPVEATVS